MGITVVWSCFATRFAEAMSYGIRHLDVALPVRFQVLIGMPFLCLHRISPFCSPADDFFSMDITFPSRLRPTWFCLFPLHLNYFCPSLFSRHRSSSGSIDFMAGLRVLFLSDADPLSFADITFVFSMIKFLFNVVALMDLWGNADDLHHNPVTSHVKCWTSEKRISRTWLLLET